LVHVCYIVDRALFYLSDIRAAVLQQHQMDDKAALKDKLTDALGRIKEDLVFDVCPCML
jgi:hypothetical protein